MENLTIPASARRSRARSSATSVALFVVGVLIDACAIVNVPGAAVFPQVPAGSVKITSLGTVLLLVVAACWMSVFWRRRYPLVVLVAGGLLAAIGISYLLLLVGAVICVSRRPRSWPLAAGVVVVVVLFAVREATTSWGAALPWFFGSQDLAQQAPGWIAATFVCAAASLLVATGVGYGMRTRARAAQSELRAALDHRRVDELTEQMVRQMERERIARDVHDALAHRLSVVSLHAGALETAASQGDAEQIARTVREQTHAALQDMRGLIGDLRSGPVQATPPTVRSVRALIADLRASGSSLTSYLAVEAPERASAQLDSAVYRITQEALTNAIKHAPGAPIDVYVEVEPHGGARIRVVNPLRPGVTPGAPGGHNGTLGIRERAAALNGTAWIGAYDDSFIVDVTLPWQEREPAADMLGA